MRFLFTAFFLLTATQAYAEMRQGVCTVTSSKRINFFGSNWFPPVVVPSGTKMTIEYDEDTVAIIRDDAREEFTVISSDMSLLRAVDGPADSTTVLNVFDPNCATHRGLGTYRGEFREIRIFTVGFTAERIMASCPCANLD